MAELDAMKKALPPSHPARWEYEQEANKCADTFRGSMNMMMTMKNLLGAGPSKKEMAQLCVQAQAEGKPTLEMIHHAHELQRLRVLHGDITMDQAFAELGLPSMVELKGGGGGGTHYRKKEEEEEDLWFEEAMCPVMRSSAPPSESNCRTFFKDLPSQPVPYSPKKETEEEFPPLPPKPPTPLKFKSSKPSKSPKPMTPPAPIQEKPKSKATNWNGIPIRRVNKQRKKKKKKK